MTDKDNITAPMQDSQLITNIDIVEWCRAKSNPGFWKCADEIEKLRAQREWQPIETAPDERRIWLFIPTFPAPANRMMVGIRYRDLDVWRVEHRALEVLSEHNKPTRLMPLPEPPHE